MRIFVFEKIPNVKWKIKKRNVSTDRRSAWQQSPSTWYPHQTRCRHGRWCGPSRAAVGPAPDSAAASSRVTFCCRFCWAARAWSYSELCSPWNTTPNAMAHAHTRDCVIPHSRWGLLLLIQYTCTHVSWLNSLSRSLSSTQSCNALSSSLR